MSCCGLSFRTNISALSLSASRIWYQPSRLATKKAGGSSRNGRDSDGRRLGVRKFGGEIVQNGTLILLQRGQRYVAGEGTRMARDHTIYSLISGYVGFRYDDKQKQQTAFVIEASPNTPRATERTIWTESLSTRLKKRREDQTLAAETKLAAIKAEKTAQHGTPL